VFFSYLIFHHKEKKASLYVNASKVESIKDYLSANNVSVFPYEQVTEDLKTLVAAGSKIGSDSGSANAEVMRVIGDSAVQKDCLIETIKA